MSRKARSIGIGVFVAVAIVCGGLRLAGQQTKTDAATTNRVVKIALKLAMDAENRRRLRLAINDREVIIGVSKIIDLNLPYGTFSPLEGAPRPGLHSYVDKNGSTLLQVDDDGFIKNVLFKLNILMRNAPLILESDLGIAKVATSAEVHAKMDTAEDKGRVVPSEGTTGLLYHDKTVGVLFEFTDDKLTGLDFGR